MGSCHSFFKPQSQRDLPNLVSEACQAERESPSVTGQRRTTSSICELNQLSETVECIVLEYSLPGSSLCAIAAASRRWSQAVKHPELWRYICTRGATPLVQPGLTQRGEEVVFSEVVWYQLAHIARGMHLLQWQGQLPPLLLLVLLQELHCDEQQDKTWGALTVLERMPVGGEHKLENPNLSAQAGDHVTSPVLHRGFLSSPFLGIHPRSGALFPRSGGIVIMLEIESLEEMSCESRAPRVWVQVSDSPCIPITIRLILSLHLDGRDRGGVVELQFDLRPDGLGLRMLIEDALASPALGALGAALQTKQMFVPTVVQCFGIKDVDGYPGASGWIPWKPAKPTVRWVESVHELAKAQVTQNTLAVLMMQ